MGFWGFGVRVRVGVGFRIRVRVRVGVGVRIRVSGLLLSRGNLLPLVITPLLVSARELLERSVEIPW